MNLSQPISSAIPNWVELSTVKSVLPFNTTQTGGLPNPNGPYIPFIMKN